jgi:hypothetical protein
MRVCHPFVEKSIKNAKGHFHVFQHLMPMTVLLTTSPQLQILHPVIFPYPIDVVDHLFNIKVATQVPLHHEAMLVYGTIVSGPWVAFGRSDKNVTSYFLAEVQRPPPIGLELSKLVSVLVQNAGPVLKIVGVAPPKALYRLVATFLTTQAARKVFRRSLQFAQRRTILVDDPPLPLSVMRLAKASCVSFCSTHTTNGRGGRRPGPEFVLGSLVMLGAQTSPDGRGFASLFQARRTMTVTPSTRPRLLPQLVYQPHAELLVVRRTKPFCSAPRRPTTMRHFARRPLRLRRTTHPFHEYLLGNRLYSTYTAY